MFINLISQFSDRYASIEKQDFLELLERSNPHGFNRYKLEKDFLLTHILIRFWELFPELIFKWGTCLNKIYYPYFRLSEDLDFIIDFPGGRASRKTLLKKYEHDIYEHLSKLWLKVAKIEKLDDYKIARYIYTYNSCIDESEQSVIFDISLKSKLQLPVYHWKILSIYQDKILEEDIFGEHTIACIDIKEALAEKVRAALTRSTPAIRDFFDIWYVKSQWGFDFENSDFRDLIDFKLAEVDYLYTDEKNYEILEKQIKSDLIPVLHREYDFSLREIYDFIQGFKK